FWLPHAMAAPTPVSAFLHSATMVKAGVFLLALMVPVLGGSALWFTIVTTTGLITLVFAAYMAMFKDDLKGLLAYSTVSHLGLITLLLGIGTPMAVVAAVFHIFNHAAFKAGLLVRSWLPCLRWPIPSACWLAFSGESRHKTCPGPPMNRPWA
ncbi:MAG: proton-conducting transporter membrane subunit, partial [Halomonas sp.]